MTDNGLRHRIALLITFIALAAYGAGYLSAWIGGWWFTVAGVLVVYGWVYKTLVK